MRRFYLENASGVRKDLQTAQHVFHSPSGLGASLRNNYEELGDGFYESTQSKSGQVNIVGTIEFMRDRTDAGVYNEYQPYEDYQTLVNWLFSGQEIMFIYIPYGNVEYRCNIRVDYLRKEEMRNNTLSVAVSFEGMTVWYRKKPLALNFALNADANYMVFDFKMGSRFPVSSALKTLEITAEGHSPAAIGLIADGEMIDPSLTLTNKYTGELLGKMKMTGLTIETGEKFRYSTLPTKSGGAGVWRIAADGKETDLSDYLSLETKGNFFSVSIGVVCNLTLAFDGPSQYAGISLYEFFRTV